MAHRINWSVFAQSRRKTLLSAFLAFALAFMSVAPAQVIFETQGHLEAESCSQVVANAETVNGFRLFRGAAECYREGAGEDGNFLLLAAQQRSVADLSVFLTTGGQSEQAEAELYGYLYYQAGGLGSTEIYRDETATERLIDRLLDWQPLMDENYDPGWDYRENPRVEIYETLVSEAKARRLAQIERQAVLLRNDEYYAATTELAELQKRSPEVDSDDYARMQQLMIRMTEITEKIAPPIPEFQSSIEYEYRPDPNAPFRQVLMGVNGPSSSGSSVFTSRHEVSVSWLARALSDAELSSVLAQVDFDEQVLVSFNVGEAQTATGRVYVTDLEIGPEMEVRSIHARIGVIESDCEYAPAVSYPFALAVVDRASATQSRSTSRGRANFGDGCQRPASGTPND